jgi:hypothetical protein
LRDALPRVETETLTGKVMPVIPTAEGRSGMASVNPWPDVAEDFFALED